MPAPATGLDLVVFAAGAAASIGGSAVLVRRIERVGARVGISEALLGLVAALAADSPEITSSVTALGGGHHGVGVGVVLGSNVFNLAALFGIGSLVAGRVSLHRRVILLEGFVATTIIAATLLVTTGVVAPLPALCLSLAVLVPYGFVIGLRQGSLDRLRLLRGVRGWLATAAQEEDAELGQVTYSGPARPWADGVTIAVTLGMVILASTAMERSGVAIGAAYKLPDVVVGGVLLAAVTSLPNAVAAIYLARRGRGAAVVSEAMNSNALNVVAGLLIPSVVLGINPGGSESLNIAWWYGAMTLGCLAVFFLRRGLSRGLGALILIIYVAFVASLILG
ncbi:MAG: sodium:calcium antiporter [Acidimicrobiales bacterium]